MSSHQSLKQKNTMFRASSIPVSDLFIPDDSLRCCTTSLSYSSRTWMAKTMMTRKTMTKKKN